MKRFVSFFQQYPPQFWLMFFGMLISTMGSSMIWPFLLIYVSERLGLPRSVTASLLTVNSITLLISSLLSGSIIDRFGRKWVMVIGLLLNGILYIFYSYAGSYGAFAILMGLAGLVTPLFRIGTDAMLADLIEPQKRIDAYSLLRLSNNLGISLGPTLGGFIASTSYNLAFYLSASGMVIYSILLTFFARETLPQASLETSTHNVKQVRLSGYATVFQDRPFITFIGSFILAQACAVLIWVLLPVHAKETYGITERLYGFIPTTNALLVVTLQLFITRITKRFNPLRILALGSLLYAFSNASVGMSRDFLGFWFSMVIMTMGELILVPTSSTYAANLAPENKRGRYLSLYGMSWGVASGIFPVLGGLLNDLVSPQATWFGGFIVGVIAMFAFYYLSIVEKSNGLKNQPVVKDP